jgi:hypothetical protein
MPPASFLGAGMHEVLIYGIGGIGMMNAFLSSVQVAREKNGDIARQRLVIAALNLIVAAIAFK